MGHLTGKVAVVTGASKGIGAGVAKELAAHGASVVVNYSSSKESAEKIVDEIKKSGGTAVAVGVSVAQSDEMETLFSQAKAAFGKVDVLVWRGTTTAGPHRPASPRSGFHSLPD